MSKHIVITGLPEATFTKFAGGDAAGFMASLQITIGEQFVQLGYAQIQELIGSLNQEWGKPIEDVVVTEVVKRVMNAYQPTLESALRTFLYPQPMTFARMAPLPDRTKVSDL